MIRDGSLAPLAFLVCFFGLALLVAYVGKGLVEELLLDEAEHGGTVLCRPVRQLFNLGLHNLVGEDAKFETEAGYYEDARVVTHEGGEAAPEENHLPAPLDASIHQYASIVNLHCLHPGQLLEVTSTGTRT